MFFFCSVSSTLHRLGLVRHGCCYGLQSSSSSLDSMERWKEAGGEKVKCNCCLPTLCQAGDSGRASVRIGLALQCPSAQIRLHPLQIIRSVIEFVPRLSASSGCFRILFSLSFYPTGIALYVFHTSGLKEPRHIRTNHRILSASEQHLCHGELRLEKPGQMPVNASPLIQKFQIPQTYDSSIPRCRHLCPAYPSAPQGRLPVIAS